MKAIWSRILAGCLCLLLAGCAQDPVSAPENVHSGSQQESRQESQQSAEDSSETSGPDYELLDPVASHPDSEIQLPRSSYVQYPVASEETLSYWLSLPGLVQSGSGSVQETAWAAGWQEATGIGIRFLSPAFGNETEEFRTMAASGSWSDIVQWDWRSSYPGGFAMARKDGVFTGLDDYIAPDGAAADLWQFLQDNPRIRQQVLDDVGQYYCFPYIRGSKYLGGMSGPILRGDLVQEAGFAVMPETIEDWERLLWNLKSMGVEYPVTAQNLKQLEALFLPAYSTRAGMCLDQDGKVRCGYETKNYRMFLVQMQKWRQEGLLDPFLFTNEKRAVTQNMLRGYSAVTYGSVGETLETYLGAVRDAPDGTYPAGIRFITANFPVMEKGQSPHYAQAALEYDGSAACIISSQCKTPELAARFLNYAYSKEGHYRMNYGKEGESWEWTQEGPAYTALVTDYETSGWVSLASAIAHYGMANLSGPFVQDGGYVFQYYDAPEQQKALHNWNDYQDSQRTLIPPILLTETEQKVYEQSMRQIEEYVSDQCISWFRGEGSPEEEWQQYLQGLEDRGLSVCKEIIAAAVESYEHRPR